MMRVGLRGDAFDFGNGDHREKFYEQKEAREKQSERADVSANIDVGGPVVTAAGREEFAMEADDDDNEALEPHADVDDDRDDEHNDEIVARPFEPEDLGHNDVGNDHQQPGPLIRAERAVHEMET